MITDHPLIRLLRDPQSALDFRMTDWESLLRAARRGQLLGRAAWIVEQTGMSGHINEKAELHLRSARRVAESQARSVHWEIRKIQDALSESGTPFILLKGAAYIAANLDARHGRLLSDIDIMVPKVALGTTEKSLIEHGWFPTKLDAYDQHYYRTWMHELPPMQHLERGTSLDVHHTILPPTALLKPDAEKLWQTSSPAGDNPMVRTLDPIDMILHSAAHLFHDGDLEHGLRDLVDIDALVKQFSDNENFWDKFASRAVELDLTRPCFYALKYCRKILNTPIPHDVEKQIGRSGSPPTIVGIIMNRLLPASLGSVFERNPSAFTQVANFWMYARSHYLRMPLHLLIPHLLRKQLTKDH